MTWQPLLKAGKPVFDSEYLDQALNAAAPKIESICGSPDAKGFQSMLTGLGLVLTTEHTRKCLSSNYTQRIV